MKPEYEKMLDMMDEVYRESEMSAGWQWAYRALKDEVLTVVEVEHHLEHTFFVGQFRADAKRGLADYLEEVADEKEIEQDQERQRHGRQGI